MVNFLLKHLAGWHQIAGLDLTLLPEGFVANMCILEKKAGVVKMVKYQSGITSTGEISSFLGTDLPVALSISGKGVLHKRLEKTPDPEVGKLLSLAIPNAKLQDFYTQLLSSTPCHILSVARKPTVEELVNLLRGTLHMNLISMTFGGLSVQGMAGLMADTILSVQDHQYQMRNGEIVKYEYGSFSSNNEMQVGGERISASIAVAYANAFQHYLPNQLTASHPVIAQYKAEYRHKTLFVKLGWGVLLFFLVLLLANYIFFSTLTSETDKMRLASTLQHSQVEHLQRLQKEVIEKETFLKKAGWMDASRISYYSDRIASTIPGSVLLTSLAIKPLNEKNSREERKQVFEEELIVITGTCKRPIDLNGWIKRLKDFAWAKKVNVENYSYDSGERAGKFKVEIQF